MANKAELARQFKMRQREFYVKVQQVILGILTDELGESRENLDLRIKYRGGNRYISLHIYGKDMEIILYTKGQIMLKLSECCHSDYEKQLFEFTDDEKMQEQLLAELRENLKWLINEFVGDFHSYMDYVSHYGDYVLAYTEMMKSYPETSCAINE